jgi:hypothetical protein
LPLQIWLGVGDWDTHATAKGHATLSNDQILNFEADQGPQTPWIYDVGTNLQFNKRLQLVIDVSGDFQAAGVRDRPDLAFLTLTAVQSLPARPLR